MHNANSIKTVLQKFITYLRNLVKRIKSALSHSKDLDFTEQDTQYYKSLADKAEAMANAFESALKDVETSAKNAEKAQAKYADKLTAEFSENEQKNNTADGVKYSIQADDDGNPIVVVDTDQGLFTGKNINYIETAKKYLDENFKDVVLPLSDYNAIYVNATGKYIYNGIKYDSKMYKAKLKACTELKNLLSVATYDGHKDDKKNHVFAPYGFDYYKTVFCVDDQVFEGIIDVGVSPQGSVFHGINKIKRVTNSGKYSNVLLGYTSEFKVGNSVDNNVSQNNSVVNNQYMQNGKENSQTKKSISHTKKVFGFEISDKANINEDLLEELSIHHPQAEVDIDGNITVYHRTSADNADSIIKTGTMKAKEDALFFSSKDSGYASDYGETVLKLKIPSTKLEVNDIFDGEVHFDIPLVRKNGGWSLDVSKYSPQLSNEKFSIDRDAKQYTTISKEENPLNIKELQLLNSGEIGAFGDSGNESDYDPSAEYDPKVYTIAQNLNAGKIPFNLYTNDLWRNLDKVSGGNAYLKKWLDVRIAKPLETAKKSYVKEMYAKLEDLQEKTKEWGIKKGTMESAAIQWYGEGKKIIYDKDGTAVASEIYTEDDLKREFPTKWQTIKNAERYFRKT